MVQAFEMAGRVRPGGLESGLRPIGDRTGEDGAPAPVLVEAAGREDAGLSYALKDLVELKTVLPDGVAVRPTEDDGFKARLPDAPLLVPSSAPSGSFMYLLLPPPNSFDISLL